MESSWQIDEVSIPQSLEVADDDLFHAIVDIQNQVSLDIMGPAAGAMTLNDMLVAVQDQTYTKIRLFVARRDTSPVGVAYIAWSTEADTRVSWFSINVLPAERNQGVGNALLDRLDAIARDSGRPVVQGQGMHRAIDDSDRIASPTGFGSLPAEDPSVRFLQENGFALEQVYRVSILNLPVPDATLDAMLSAALIRAGSDYRIHTWAGDTPDCWLDDLAIIMNRMSTDAPAGNLEIEEETWDADRVRYHDERRRQSGRVRLAAAVEHIPTQSLVAYGSLSLSGDRQQPVHQGVTLVLREHRGHRLGMVTKIANIQQLQVFSPESPSIITDNAEENRPMLDVNEAVGFVPLAYSGAWKKTYSEC